MVIYLFRNPVNFFKVYAVVARYLISTIGCKANAFLRRENRNKFVRAFDKFFSY